MRAATVTGTISGKQGTVPVSAPAPRRRRSDAVENREKLLAAARTVFTEQGERASLNAVARRAGVGSGTLYRHFPTLRALLIAIVADDVERLCERGRALLSDDDPDAALRRWLRLFATHAGALRGLLAVQLATDFGPDGPESDTAFAAAHDAILATGAALLDRSEQAGTTPAGADVRDVLRLVNAVAWAGHQAPGDADLVDRLLALCLRPPA